LHGLWSSTCCFTIILVSFEVSKSSWLPNIID
jgi:hypothetical protein